MSSTGITSLLLMSLPAPHKIINQKIRSQVCLGLMVGSPRAKGVEGRAVVQTTEADGSTGHWRQDLNEGVAGRNAQKEPDGDAR